MIRRTFLCLSARAGLAGRRRERSSRQNIRMAHKAASWGAQLGLAARAHSWVLQLGLTTGAGRQQSAAEWTMLLEH